jgi:glycosyltransferase involved in cell wall biosynthesis
LRRKPAGTSAPAIAPVEAGVARPFWSVMIPTYDSTEMLEGTLRGVLDQDPGADRMQIAVVDDCSPNGRAREIVGRLAPGRVEFHAGASNVGLAGNWNACLARSRGHWVHLLHQDDRVLPGFYERLARADRERPDALAAFCRPADVDRDGVQGLVYPLERVEPGVIEGWADRIIVEQRVLCPSIVVRRSAYEALGGFRTDLSYTLDWEMWVRIALDGPVWYEPEVLAHWRNHEGSETGRLGRANAQLPDFGRLFEIVYGYAPAERRDALLREATRLMRWRWLLEFERLLDEGSYARALGQIRAAFRYEEASKRHRILFGYFKWVAKVRLRRLLSGGAGGRAAPRGRRPGPGDAAGIGEAPR